MTSPRHRGFTILELLLAMGIFLIICAAMFELLDLSQRKYNTETQLSAAYQEARYAMDQMTRDFNVSGYPPPGMFTAVPLTKPWTYAVGPVAWSPGYPSGTDCQIGLNCTPTPGDYDLIIETRLSNDPSGNVSWIWYHLDLPTNTLLREVVTKTNGDPYTVVSSANTAAPLLANVMNNPGPALIAQIQAQNPSMYSSGPQPIFQYFCDTPTGTLPCASPLAAGYNTPRNIRDVMITLIVKTPQNDLQTQRIKLVELNGRGHRLNPNS